MTPATLYTWTLLILTGPLLLALAALLRHQRPTSRSDKPQQTRSTTALASAPVWSV